MDNIIAYTEGNLDFEELQDFLWGSGQQLIDEIGEEQFVFYLLAEEGEFYSQRR